MQIRDMFVLRVKINVCQNHLICFAVVFFYIKRRVGRKNDVIINTTAINQGRLSEIRVAPFSPLRFDQKLSCDM